MSRRRTSRLLNWFGPRDRAFPRTVCDRPLLARPRLHALEDRIVPSGDWAEPNNTQGTA